MGGGEASSEDDQSFQCGICLERVFKPIVHACGHLFCFWCVHHAMTGRGFSQCPMCRSPYMHFPRICELLHRAIAKTYPAEYKQRGDEIRELETELQTLAPSLSVEEDRALEISDFFCDSCKKLICRPVVMNCGHVFCRTCIKTTEGNDPKCSTCGMTDKSYSLQVCREFKQYLEKSYPAEYKQREEETKDEELNKNSASTSDPAAPDSTKDSTAVPKAFQELFGRYGPFKGKGQDIHLYVGCDGCGVHPILGPRYRCKDCPEKIGYDLCQECYSRGSPLEGRFNQRHTKEHQMEEVPAEYRYTEF